MIIRGPELLGPEGFPFAPQRSLGDIYFELRGETARLIADAKKGGEAAGTTGGTSFGARFKTAMTTGDFGSFVKGGFGLAAGLMVFGAIKSAISGVTDVMRDAVDAAIADEASVAKLTTAIEANDDAWDGNMAKVEEVIASRLRLGFADEDQRDSLAKLVTATEDVNEALDLQRTAMDLARLMGISLGDAGLLIAKVYGGNVAILKRYGIQVTKGATAAEALAEIQQLAADQAEVFAGTTAGKMQAAQLQMGEAMEKLGYLLTPIIAQFAGFVADTLPGMIDLVGGLGTAFNELNRFISPHIALQQDTEAAVRAAAIAAGEDAEAVWAFKLAQDEAALATARLTDATNAYSVQQGIVAWGTYKWQTVNDVYIDTVDKAVAAMASDTAAREANSEAVRKQAALTAEAEAVLAGYTRETGLTAKMMGGLGLTLGVVTTATYDADAALADLGDAGTTAAPKLGDLSGAVEALVGTVKTIVTDTAIQQAEDLEAALSSLALDGFQALTDEAKEWDEAWKKIYGGQDEALKSISLLRQEIADAQLKQELALERGRLDEWEAASQREANLKEELKAAEARRDGFRRATAAMEEEKAAIKAMREQLGYSRTEAQKLWDLWGKDWRLHLDVDKSEVEAAITAAMTLIDKLRAAAATWVAGLFGGEGRQHGGPVVAGQGYLVGERGPEFFLPERSGTILPHGQVPAAASAGVSGIIEHIHRIDAASAANLASAGFDTEALGRLLRDAVTTSSRRYRWAG